MAGLYIKRKKEFHLFRWLSSFACVSLIIASGWYGYQWFITGDKPPVVPLPAAALADPEIDETPVTLGMINQHKVADTHPRYISIPSLNIVKARVQSVGLTENNMLDTPKNISDTAWYDKSAKPGQGFGSVIIDGHNGGITRNGVFAGLDKLRKNDEITVERGDGKKIRYSVMENKTETLKETNATGMQRLMTPIDKNKEGLGLITCAGNWVPRDKVFDKRILIRAVAIE